MSKFEKSSFSLISSSDGFGNSTTSETLFYMSINYYLASSDISDILDGIFSGDTKELHILESRPS